MGPEHRRYWARVVLRSTPRRTQRSAFRRGTWRSTNQVVRHQVNLTNKSRANDINMPGSSVCLTCSSP